MLRIRQSLGSPWSYTYDSNGNLATQTDAKSKTITFSYDDLSRLTGKTYSGDTYASYTYDSTTDGNYGKGRRTGMSDALGSTSYKYDTRGRLIKERRTISSINYDTEFTYYSNDWTKTIEYPTGETVTPGYNGRGLPYDLSGSVAGDIVDSTLYNNLGQITDIDFANGVWTDYSYWDVGGPHDYYTGESYGRLAFINTQGGGSVFQYVYYEWDKAGNLKRQYDCWEMDDINYSYDSLNRLTAVSGPYSRSYSYDEIGNIVSFNGTSYSYGTKPHAVTSAGSTSYSYDSNGNMVSRGGTTITWDVENRPTAVGSGATFVYDGDGNRGKKVEGGETVIYVNRYYEKNLSTGVVTTYYYLGGKLVALRRGAALEFVHLDHLGGTNVTTDTNGDRDAIRRYYPYGATESSSGTLETDKEFTGQRHDATGLYYYNARYYDPTLGRFISPDPLVPDVNNPQSFNRYTYVLNNPLKHIDPSGLDAVLMGGDGSTEDDLEEWKLSLIEDAIIGSDETVVLLWDTNRGELNAEERAQDLVALLQDCDLTDIKLIGFSEGAAAITVFLDHLAGGHFMGVDHATIREIHHAFTLELPSGTRQSEHIYGYDSSDLAYLPYYLSKAGQKYGFDMQIHNIYNRASVVHTPITGWSPVSDSYDWRPWYLTLLHWSSKPLGIVGHGLDFGARALSNSQLHNHVLTCDFARGVMYSAIHGQ